MDKKIIGKRLRELRGELKIDYVAQKCNISISALVMYETGHRIPRDEIKIRLAEFYGKSVQDIFFE